MTLTETAIAVVLAASALTGLGVLIKWARGGFRTIDKAEQLLAKTDLILALVDKELKHNHGGSMKDDVHATAISVHRAHNRIDEIHEFLHTFAEANSLVLPLIHDAIKAAPPTERESA